MSTREVQAFEDVVTELVGALHHAGQALASSAAAVALMATAEKEAGKEANLPRDQGNHQAATADGDTSDFHRGFEAGASTKLGLVRALSDWVTAAHQGKERLGDALGEIAVILESELKVEPGTLWPLQLTGKLAGTDAIGVSDIMRMLLSAKKGGVSPDVLFGAIAKKVEELTGLPPGAIWVEGSDVNWAMEEVCAGDKHD